MELRTAQVSRLPAFCMQNVEVIFSYVTVVSSSAVGMEASSHAMTFSREKPLRLWGCIPRRLTRQLTDFDSETKNVVPAWPLPRLLVPQPFSF